jgi:type I restriction enzyme S subunit
MEVKPGYKQTEVGVIPEEWRISKVGDVCGCIVPGRNKPRLFDGDIPWITTPDLENGKLVTTSRLGLCISRAEAKSVGSKIVPPGSVLMSCAGELGIVAMTKNEIVVNQQLHVFIPTDRIEAVFLLSALAYRRDQIEKIGTKTAVPYLNKSACNSILVPLPRPREQRAIAEVLSDVDGLLAELDRLIGKKRDLKQAAMQQLLTGRTRFPGFHGEWEVNRLGDVATFFKGKGLPKSALSESGAEPCIHYGELFTRYPETIGEILSRTDNSVGAFRSVANDVLMPTSDVTPRGLAKASCIRVDGVILGGDILVIRSDTNLIHGPFLSLVIRYKEAQVLQFVTGSTVYHLYGRDMKNFTFSMPTVPEQTAIADVLSDMDAELAALEQRRDKTHALKQAMMQELLTGRTRLISPEEAHA